MFKSLLPPNATQLERDIEQVTAGKHDVSVPIADTWNAAACPAHLLPWLAWAVSVDNWNPAWSDDVKRNVIQLSIHVHQIKGTVDVVRQALDALGVQIEMTEWFENGGAPGTFGLLAWANDNLGGGTLLSQQLYDDLERSIKEVSPASRHFDFKVGALFKNIMGIAAAPATSLTMERHTAQVVATPLQSSNQFGIAASAHAVSIVR